MTGNPWQDLRSESEPDDKPYDPRVRPWCVGAASARPSATQVPQNSFFLATDTKVASFSDGSAWSVVGGATVATAVSALGTGEDGRVAHIRGGSSPYDFLALTYDATYGKWVSPAFVAGSGGRTTAHNTASTWMSVNNTFQGGDDGTATDVFFPYKAFVDAGLTLQWRLMCVLISDGVTTVDGGLQITTAAINASLGTPSTDAALVTSTSGSGLVKDSGWVTAASVTSNTYGYITIRYRSSATDTGTIAGATCWLRWVS